jgi:site-specific recombinase XerD
MDIRRSFTEAEWAHVLQCLDQVAVGPERLRLKCILELLVTSGIRLDELAKARLWPIAPEALPDLPQTWMLTVTGKRNKTREVPLNPDVVIFWPCMAGEFLEEDKHCPAIRTACH